MTFRSKIIYKACVLHFNDSLETVIGECIQRDACHAMLNKYLLDNIENCRHGFVLDTYRSEKLWDTRLGQKLP